MHQYLPFPLSYDLSNNHSVWRYDFLKLYHNLTLQPAIKMGETYFRKGRSDICTDIQETCLGALFLQQPKGIQRYYKFEIKT